MPLSENNLMATPPAEIYRITLPAKTLSSITTNVTSTSVLWEKFYWPVRTSTLSGFEMGWHGTISITKTSRPPRIGNSIQKRN